MNSSWQMKAYEGYEELSSFTAEGLQKYREHLLAKTVPQTAFIRRHVCEALGRPQIDVLELASGNGRLLVSLASEGLLSRGVGVELSHSRVEFARQWAIDMPIKFSEQNITHFSKWGDYDLSALITGAIQYFTPAEQKQVFKLMKASAQMSLFELYKRPKDQRIWHKLDDSDRFSYILDEYTPDNPSRHTKHFIKRDGSVDTRVEMLHYYSLKEFLLLCGSVGFRHINVVREDENSIVVLVS